METNEFLSRLALVAAGAVAALGLLYYAVPGARPYGTFILATLGLFVVICLLLYYFGLRTARSANRYAFNGLISVSVFGKMVVTMLFLGLYRKVAAPENEWYVLIFLLTYAVYTVYEVWFMMRLAKLK